MSARPEIAMPLATIGVLVAMGMGALQRGEQRVGWACLGAAGAVAAWLVVAWLRSRRQ